MKNNPWNFKKMKEIGTVISGSTPKTNKEEFWGGDISWITPADLSYDDNWYVKKTNKSITDLGAESSNLKMLPIGSVLLSSRAPIGKVALVGTPMCTNQGFKSVVCKTNQIDPEYLYYYLRSQNDYLNSIGRGATFTEISKKQVEELVVPFPTLIEQKRIVKILRLVDDLIRKRELTQSLLRQYKEALFISIFGDPASNPKEWEFGRVLDLTSFTQYGSSKKADIFFEAGKVPILRMNNITDKGEWDLSSLKYIDFADEDSRKYIVTKGELLFNRTNSEELVGKTAVFQEDSIYAFAGYLIKLVPNKLAYSEFISGYLNSSYGKALLKSKAKVSGNLANINAEELKNIPIYLPPLEIQAIYINSINKLNLVRVEQNKSLSELRLLFESLLKRAFIGKIFEEVDYGSKSSEN